jgi:Protein of unknown function (DUF4230)
MSRQDGACPFCGNTLNPSSSLCPGCGKNILPSYTSGKLSPKSGGTSGLGAWPRNQQTSKVPCLPLALAVVALCLLLVVGTALGIAKAISIWLTPRTEKVITLPSSSAVITQIQSIGKLETVSYTLEKVIAYDPDAGQWYHFLGDRTTLFAIHGEVIAGFDLSKLSSNDIKRQGEQINNASITLNMPAPQILHTQVDLNKTKIYQANSGVYSLWNNQLDSDTTRKVLGSAEDSLRKDACEGDILQKTSDNARAQLTSFLKTLGFSNVTINIPAGTCS